MARHGEKGSFAADIPDAVIAEAVAAVDKTVPSVRASTAAPADPTLSTNGDSVRPGDPTLGDPVRPERSAAESRDEQPRPGEVVLTAAAAEQLRAQLGEAHQLRLRAAADLENFRKRAAREKADAQRLGVERLVADLLPVLDNLDRALQAVPEGPVALGVAMTRRLLDDTLARHGLRSVAADTGTVFDPRVHQAVMTVQTEEHPAGTIVQQEQRGYCLYDRLLRPAAVVVAAPAGPSTTPRDPGEREAKP